MTNGRTRDVLLDAVKGFLILCIVLEHNSILTTQYDWIRPFCDAFAAGCFLILTFAWPLKRLSFKTACDKYLSYWWPFVLFISATTVLHFMLYDSGDIKATLIYYVKALFLASPGDIKMSSGFMYFWFLPCLTVLYLLRWLGEYNRHFTLVVAIIAWLTIGSFEDEFLTYFMFSLHVIAFIYILGVVYSYCHDPLIHCSLVWKIVIVLAFIACSIATYYIGWQLFLAGGIIPSWQEPSLLAFYSFFMLIAIPGIYHLLSFMPNIIKNMFVYLGEKSLIVYLFHPLVFVAFTQVFPVVTHGILSLLLTLIICAVIALVLQKIPVVNQLLFPRKISSLLSVGRL